MDSRHSNFFFYYLKIFLIKNGTYPDIFATSGEHLRIFEMDDEKGTVKLIKELVNVLEIYISFFFREVNLIVH